jgi:asparagine synthase (glutamine-hydrolysing)
MCGIAGLISKKNIPESRFDDFVKSSELMNHRGPDFRGVERFQNVLLIHYRLSILDLNPRSNQPFHTSNGRYSATYNGEIYNFHEIKSKYKIETQTTSDTEVMLESFALSEGNDLASWNGIFAMAILDKEDLKIHFIRDRFGVKPLYVFEDDEIIAFSSEAKVILDWLDGFKINKKVLSQFIWFGNKTGSDSFVEGLRTIQPGTHITYSLLSPKIITQKTFWSINDVQTINPTVEEAAKHTRILLEKAIERQLVSDTSIGVLLSGGIDSSCIVAFGSKHYEQKLDTYSVDYDFNIGNQSELKKAASIAKLFGTNHHEFQVTSTNTKDIFKELVFQYDEPFADPAMIPLYQLAKVCSASKRVILQGDGGDEFFAGYRRYNVIDKFAFWKFASSLYPVLPYKSWRERMKRVSFILNQNNIGKMFAYYLSEEVPYKSPYRVFSKEYSYQISTYNWSEDYEKACVRFSSHDKVQELLFVDTEILLPNRYLEKVDKATMLNSIEARVPFLENDLTQYALSLPSSIKVRNGEKKFVLKKSLEGIIPNEILYGPKVGFSVPFRNWLKGDLYDFAIDSFKENPTGILNTEALIDLMHINKSGKADYSGLLWKSLVLSHWLKIYSSKIR